MRRQEDSRPTTGRQASLRDEEMTSTRVDRRSFVSRAVAIGSIAAGVALATACPGGTDSDGGSESEPESPSDSDSTE